MDVIKRFVREDDGLEMIEWTLRSILDEAIEQENASEVAGVVAEPSQLL